MAQYYPQQQQQSYNPQNLQFYPSSYAQPVSGHTTPSQAQYGYGQPPASSQVYPSVSGSMSGGGPGYGASFGAGPGVSGRMGEQGGLRTGWLAAFGTEGYDGEPPLLEELGVNFGHIKGKVCEGCRLPCFSESHTISKRGCFNNIVEMVPKMHTSHEGEKPLWKSLLTRSLF